MSVQRIKTEIQECHCERCGRVWIASFEKENGKWQIVDPITCPSCRSPYWNKKPTKHPKKS